MVDPHSPYFSSNFNDSVTSPLIEDALKDNEHVPPPFPPPIKKEKPKTIIPSYLLRDAQKVREKQEDKESLLPSKSSEKLSEELRAKRKQTYFPDNSKKEDN